MKKMIIIPIALALIFSLFNPVFSRVSAKEFYSEEDLNKDGTVDILDIGLVAKQYSTSSAVYDLNKDSLVDIYDLTKVSKSYGKNSFGLGIVTGTTINFRTSPNSTDSTNIITSISKSSTFSIIEDLGEWYKVKYNDKGTIKDGYVYALYTLPLRDDCIDSYLGFISSRYESTIFSGNIPISVRNPGTISNNAGDSGGKSYGMYQLSSKIGSVDLFLTWLKADPVGKPFYDTLSAAKIADGNIYGTSFDKEWGAIASKNFSDFFELQRRFVKINYFDKAAILLKTRFNFDISTKSFALKEALWSTAVQYGFDGNGTTTIGALDLFYNAGLNNPEDVLITNIYNLKIKHAELVNNILLKNRALDEKFDILNIYNSYNLIK